MTAHLVWLSVDFDFFVREEASWRFDHGYTTHYTHDIWTQRESEFRVRRKNLRREMGLRYADPHPTRFWAALERLGYRFDQLRRIVVADSHEYAYQAFDLEAREGREPADVKLVNVDAHHDLFYSVAQLQWSAGRDEPSCENWHFFTHLKHRGLKSLVVYPRWEGLAEWDRSMGKLYRDRSASARRLARLIRARTAPTVWGRPAVARAAGQVGVIFIARSGAWVPPWHDGAFVRFCRAAAVRYGCELSTPFILEESSNPLEPRLPARAA